MHFCQLLDFRVPELNVFTYFTKYTWPQRMTKYTSRTFRLTSRHQQIWDDFLSLLYTLFHILHTNCSEKLGFFAPLAFCSSPRALPPCPFSGTFGLIEIDATTLKQLLATRWRHRCQFWPLDGATKVWCRPLTARPGHRRVRCGGRCRHWCPSRR